MTEFGVHTCRDDNTNSAATGNARTLEEHRCAIGDPRVDVNRGDGLANSRQLAGKRELIDVQVRCLHEPKVCRDNIPGVEQDDVSRYQALGWNETRASVPTHPSRTGPEHPQCLNGPHGLNFGYEPDQSIERQHADNRAAFLPFSEIECQSCGNGEQSDDEALKLMNKNGKRTDFLPPADCIRPIMLQPLARLILGKTGDDGDFKRGEHVDSRPPMGRVKRTFGCLRGRHWMI